MAILYEIEESGFGDMLKSGLVITGGVAETANLSNFIYELSGYRVRTGYPKGQFSTSGCAGIKDPSAATSVGLILAAKDELGINCAQAGRKTETGVTIENDGNTMPETEPAEVEVPESEPVEQETVREQVQEAKPEREPRRGLFEGLKVYWTNTKKKAEEAFARTGEKLDEMRNEEV